MHTRPGITIPLLTFALLGLMACQGQTDHTQASEPHPQDRIPQDHVHASEQDVAALCDANTRFAFSLYRLLADTGEPNVFLSPYSIYTALGMTLEGARGETTEQMLRVLHMPSVNADRWPTQRLHAAAGKLIEHFSDEDRPYELHVANALWGEQQMPFREDFLATLRRYYEADLHPVDFANDPESSRLRINQWVEDRTQGRIEDLLPEESIDFDTRLVLTNAIYFKAAWATPFPEQQTRDRDFHLPDGSVIEVPTMRRQDVRIGYHQDDDLSAIELPYEDGGLSMLILMPKEPDGLPALRDQLDAQRLGQVADSLESVQAELQIPKFRFESQFNLNQALVSLGMPLAFSRDADLTGIAGTDELFISDVVHKAFVDVHEQGTEAAAATGVVVGLKAMPMEIPQVRVDRPFLFLIRDAQTHTVLFLGQVSDPR